MPTAGNVLCGCGQFMRCVKNDVVVEELHEDGSPYRLWAADRYRCEACGAEVITGFACAPLIEHWRPNYAMYRARLQPIYPGRCT